MLHLDEFESQFRRASKDVFKHQPVTVTKVLLVTDLDRERGRALEQEAREFLLPADPERQASWQVLCGDDYTTTQDLVTILSREQPDLIVTYRSLKEADKNPVYSLGTYLDVLAQVVPVPVLVIPHPDARPLHVQEGTREVMVVTDHLTGDDRLVNWGASFTRPGGLLLLTHVEDEAVFERYVRVIGKIPTIDTDEAREAIRTQLLREPAEYIETCRSALLGAKAPLRVEAVVQLGRRVRTYRELVKKHTVDLVVLNTKDQEQLAMDGLAYSLAIELKDVPLLLL